MTTSQKARHGLFVAMQSVLGDEHAGTLMDMFPSGSEEPATKGDLDTIQRDVGTLQRDVGELRLRFDDVDRRFEQVDRRFDSLEEKLVGVFRTELAGVRTEVAGQTRTILFSVVGVMVAYGSLILAAARMA